MKFTFCGGLEPPEWLFMAVSYLARVSAVRIRLIAGQLVKHITEGAFERDKLWKLCSGSNLTPTETESVLSAVHFIVVHAGKFTVPPAVLIEEVTQLGLPLESAQMIVKAYNRELPEIQRALAAQYLKLPTVHSLNWKINYDLRTCSPSADLSLRQSTGEVAKLTLSAAQLGLLIAELERARAVMNSMN